VRVKDAKINQDTQKINSYEEMLRKLGNLKTQPSGPPIGFNN
jgi:hypothetical protein